jgi:glycine cleavage system transcriptional repressor
MEILRGHFAMTLILAVPAGIDVESLRSELVPVGERLGLEALNLGEVEDVEAAAPEPTHIVTVYGADHVGIVHAVAAALAAADVNITDLSTRLLAGDEGRPLYVMLLEVVAGAVDLEALLAGVAAEHRVEVSVRPLPHDAL